MPTLNFYKYSNNPTPLQLVEVCKEFVSLVNERKAHLEGPRDEGSGVSAGLALIWPKHPYDLLESAEGLAEQILGHYSNLQVVSQVLTDFRLGPQKLPHRVEDVFLWACLREHPSLDTLLSQTHELYQDGTDRVAIKKRDMITQYSMVTSIPKPTLWQDNGKLKYHPVAFEAIHRHSLVGQIRQFFDEGFQEVEAMVSDFPRLDRPSQKLLGEEISKKVYASLLPDDSPVRITLRAHLDDVQDANVRIYTALSSCLDATPASDAGAPAIIEHALALIEKLPHEQKNLVFTHFSLKIEQWIGTQPGGYSAFEYPEVGIPLLVKLLKGLNECGFNALVEIGKYIPYHGDRAVTRGLVEEMVGSGIQTNRKRLTCAHALQEAALIAAEEQQLLCFGLKNTTLLKLVDLRGEVPLIRAALMKDGEGRDLVFGADLGL